MHILMKCIYIKKKYTITYSYKRAHKIYKPSNQLSLISSNFNMKFLPSPNKSFITNPFLMSFLLNNSSNNI